MQQVQHYPRGPDEDVPIVTAFASPAYRRVQSEEGPYDAYVGCNLIAVSQEGDTTTDWIMLGEDGWPVITEQTTAEQSAEDLLASGSIAAFHWCPVSTRVQADLEYEWEYQNWLDVQQGL